MAKKSITYYWGNRNLVVGLGNRTARRIRLLYMFEFVCTSGLATIFFIQALPFNNNYFHWVAGTGASLLYILAARRFLMRMFLSESLMLDDQYFTIIKKTIFSKQARRYSWRSLGALHYMGKQPKTDHPLKGRSFDYFGFETQEHLIQSLHNEGNLFFDTAEGNIYFANGVYSWDAEEMVQMMKLFAGNNLVLGPEWEQMLQAPEMDDVQ